MDDVAEGVAMKSETSQSSNAGETMLPESSPGVPRVSIAPTVSETLLRPLAKRSIFMRPTYLEKSAWLEHIPFAYWLIEAHQPRVFVELGTHYGSSYFAFCQAVDRLGLDTRCFAIDTWKGDDHAGHYGEEVFEKVVSHNQSQYSGFSRLVRSSFDAALEYFSDGLIDLLHIDGLHTFEAVRHDFESWLPKLSDRGVVVFHDSNVRERRFGVYKLIEELRGIYPSFEFTHGHGLAVLGVGAQQNDLLRQLFEASGDDYARRAIHDVFGRLGRACADAHVATERLTRTRQLEADNKRWREEADKLAKLLDKSQHESTVQSNELSELRHTFKGQENRYAFERSRHAEQVEVLQDLRNQLETNVRDLKARLDHTTIELKERTEALLKLHAESPDYQRALASMRAEAEQSESALASAMGDLQATKDALADAHAAAAVAEASHQKAMSEQLETSAIAQAQLEQSYQDEIAELQQQLAIAVDNAALQQSARADLESEFIESRATSVMQEEDLKEEINEVRQQLETALQHASEQQQERDAVEDALARARATAVSQEEELLKELAALRQEAAIAHTQVEAQKRAVSEAEQSLSDALRASANREADLQALLTRTQHELMTARQDIKRQEEALSSAEKALSDVRSDSAKDQEIMRGELAKFRMESATLLRKLEALTGERDAAFAELKTIKSDLDHATADLQRKTNDARSLRTNRDELLSKVNGLEHKLEEGVRELTQLTEIIQCSDAELDRLRDEFRSYRSSAGKALGTAIVTLLRLPVGKPISDRNLQSVAKKLTKARLFDPDFYRSRNSDVIDPGMDPLKHYLVHGAYEGRVPFDLSPPDTQVR